MKIYISAYNGISDEEIGKAISDFTSKFKDVTADDFVNDEPNVIWFYSGGSEHNALDRIEPQNRYCFIASKSNNSWAAATEVKALLNEKGIQTRIFDYEKLETVQKVYEFLNVKRDLKISRLGLIGESADWLVSSVPDYDLLEEVLNIQIQKYSWDDVLALEESTSDSGFEKSFSKFKFDTYSENLSLMKKINTLVDNNRLHAIATGCFDLLEEHNYSACLPVSSLNNLNFPAVCEGDLCSAAGMIVFQRLSGMVPWMANLNHIDKEGAIFSHCTAPEQFLEDFEITTHFESGKASAIKGNFVKKEVTVFRIDNKLEYCFLTLGEITETGQLLAGCRTQVKIKMSSKSLWLLREFPLGNHHLIIPGDHTDLLAEYFTFKGFRIV